MLMIARPAPPLNPREEEDDNSLLDLISSHVSSSAHTRPRHLSFWLSLISVQPCPAVVFISFQLIQSNQSGLPGINNLGLNLIEYQISFEIITCGLLIPDLGLDFSPDPMRPDCCLDQHADTLIEIMTWLSFCLCFLPLTDSPVQSREK